MKPAPQTWKMVADALVGGARKRKALEALTGLDRPSIDSAVHRMRDAGLVLQCPNGMVQITRQGIHFQGGYHG